MEPSSEYLDSAAFLSMEISKGSSYAFLAAKVLNPGLGAGAGAATCLFVCSSFLPEINKNVLLNVIDGAIY